MNFRSIRPLSLALLFIATSLVSAEPTTSTLSRAADAPTTAIIKVAVKATPPFVILNPDGNYKGISIALWEITADLLGLKYEYHEMKLKDLVDGVSAGHYDIGMGAITITAEREKQLDFTLPYYSSGLSIAVVAESTPGWWLIVKQIFSTDFLSAVFALIIVLLISGLLIWFFERKSNADQFGGATHKGIAAGFWWAAVTMTTVGYGDKSPQTLGGRLVGVVWMFTAVIIISSFTASIASSLTVGKLSSKVSSQEDLPTVRVGTVTDSTSADYLNNQGVSYQKFENLPGALDALEDEKIDAVVYDAPLLRYWTRQRHKSKLIVLPHSFNPQDYAFILPENSQLREQVNQKSLELIEKPAWKSTIKRYLGE